MHDLRRHAGARLAVETYHGTVDPASVVRRVARERQPAILESIAEVPSRGRWSIFAFDPLEIAEEEPDCAGDPYPAIAERFARYPWIEHGGDLPFVGGWIGYFSYEAGAQIERIACDNPPVTSLPLVRLALYDSAVLFDRHAGRWYAIAVDWPDSAGLDRPDPHRRVRRLCGLLDDARASHPPAPPRALCGPLAADWTHAEYVRRVRRAKDYIAAGDVYEVNLTHRFVTRTQATPLDIYLRLRHSNPSEYAALLFWGDAAVISSSPELFLELRDGRVTTRPIKGTRPRTGDARLDAIRRRELAHSEKDRAELNMIVDLLRNDLGKVCRWGSVRVVSAGDLEACPTVYHRVATITGRLNRKTSALDLLRAASPGGSVTGAPKVRAMQIIDEVETVRRGVYCGSIGYLGLDGAMAMNIAIRTMIYDGGALHIHTGGAIVADSDADDEYTESIAKATGLFRAMERERDKSRGRNVERSKSRKVEESISQQPNAEKSGVATRRVEQDCPPAVSRIGPR